MRNVLPLATCLALIAVGPAVAADPVQGEWLTHARNAKVKIAPCPADARLLCGTITWVRDPMVAKAKDTQNLDPALRSRPIMGMPVLTALQRSDTGRWAGGRLYDASTGKSYDVALAIRPDATLKVDVCLLKVACRVQTWRRD